MKLSRSAGGDSASSVYTKVMNEQLDRIEAKLVELSEQLDKTYRSAEKMRKYFFWTMIITVALIVIPLLVLPFVIPAFLQSVEIPAGF